MVERPSVFYKLDRYSSEVKKACYSVNSLRRAAYEGDLLSCQNRHEYEINMGIRDKSMSLGNYL